MWIMWVCMLGSNVKWAQLGSAFHNAQNELRIDRNDPDNSLNRVKLLLRSCEVKGQLGVRS